MSPAPEPDAAAAAQAVGARLAEIYRGVHVAMRDLPVCNPRLDVEAIGFQPFGDYALGVLLTPWFMNVIICARSAPDLPATPAGAATQWALPAGGVDFVAARLEGFGRLDSCSLFSPMDAFADHAAAKATAIAALDQLIAPAAEPAADPRAPQHKKLNRRALFFGARRDDAGAQP